MSLLYLNLVSVVLIIFTFHQVIKDRAFSKRSRQYFLIALAVCMLAILFSYFILFYKKYDSLIYELFKEFVCFIVGGASLFTCIYYYYHIAKTYKRDRLTGLMIRHNMLFEMEDTINQSYDIALLDVDNFKLINDKYGHDKGDEALVTVVNTTLKHLPKGCRMYRYGGDEFVIISTSVPRNLLENALEATNEDLLQDDYRVSYGIVRHEVGVDSNVSLAQADKEMYENKRMLKSENIWDDMTGLYNLRGFIDELDSFRKSVSKENHIVCLFGVDVERLSNINKAYGYAEGNLVITVLSNCLKKCLRGRDFIGHMGSDEFVVAIECTDANDTYISDFAHNLDELISTSYEISVKDYSVKLNIDKLFIDNNEVGPSENYVDSLLYSKQEDKDNRRKNEMSDGDKEYNNEEEKLALDILDHNLFQYAFQPIVSAKNAKIVAYESLMRSDTETMLSPLKILNYASINKRSYDVEKDTFFNTLYKFAGNSDIPDDVKIYINSIPGHFLNDSDFSLLHNMYSDFFERMVVEINEQREIDDDSLALLNARREKLGFSLAVDDYGSGCSNTNTLLRYMPQIVKLDRLLITGIDRNSKKQFFVNSIISFAKENDMLTIAEGVETEGELKTVIKLGVDMVQGYVIAKPSIEVVTEIPGYIVDIIVEENLKVRSNQRMAYTVSDVCELSVVTLAMEDYSRINVHCENVAITGSTEYAADMTIKIKDNIDCVINLSDVNLTSVDDRPCIEIGENTNLTLHVEGTCKLNSTGIYVPETSSLTIVGNGTLKIAVKGHDCYAIGAGSEAHFGKIFLKNSGLIMVDVDGEQCVGIGGGIAGPDSIISMTSGTVKLTIAGVEAVGLGAYSGDVPIRIIDSELISDFRVNKGAVIGTLNGNQDIQIENFRVEMDGSGRDVAVVGCPGEVTGNIKFNAGGLTLKFSGHNLYFIGGSSGNVNIDLQHSNVNILGEGDNITGFGTRSEEADLTIKESAVVLVINASAPQALGASKKDIMYLGPAKEAKLNGVSYDIEAI